MKLIRKAALALAGAALVLGTAVFTACDSNVPPVDDGVEDTGGGNNNSDDIDDPTVNPGGSENPGSSDNPGGSENPGPSANPGTGYLELPIIPAGNQNTKVDGAGIWIYLDNKDLGISGGNTGTVIENIDVVVTDTVNNENISIQSKSFDDFGAGEATVRLYIVLSEAHPNIKVNITGTLNGKRYKGEAVFVEGVYQFDFVATAISLDPNETSVKPGEEVVFKVVSTAPYRVDVTDKCTFTILDEDSTGSELNKNTLSAGSSEGTVTVTASYNDEVTATATIRIDANSLPTVLSSSKIEGSGIQVFISKDVVKTVPSEDSVNIIGTLKTDNPAYKVYESDDLLLTIREINDQGTQFRIYFTQPDGLPAEAEATETFVITFDNVTVNVEFYGNALKSSSIKIEQ